MANDTKTLTSERGEIIPLEKAKWISNQLEFAKPFIIAIAGFYFLPLLATLGNPENVLELSDFIPSQAVVGSTVLYVMNTAWDFLRKWAGEEKYIVKK